MESENVTIGLLLIKHIFANLDDGLVERTGVGTQQVAAIIFFTFLFIKDQQTALCDCVLCLSLAETLSPVMPRQRVLTTNHLSIHVADLFSFIFGNFELWGSKF